MDKLIDIFNTPIEQCRHWVNKKCWNPQVTLGLTKEHACPFGLEKRHICRGFVGYKK